MYIEILFIIITVAWIILGTSFMKLHPVLVLLIGSLFLGVCLEIKLINITFEIFEGFALTSKK